MHEELAIACKIPCVKHDVAHFIIEPSIKHASLCKEHFLSSVIQGISQCNQKACMRLQVIYYVMLMLLLLLLMLLVMVMLMLQGCDTVASDEYNDGGVTNAAVDMLYNL